MPSNKTVHKSARRLLSKDKGPKKPPTLKPDKIRALEALGKPVKSLARVKVIRQPRTLKADTALGESRYPGHDSDPNKRALVDVLTYRNGRGIPLSPPETKALKTSTLAKTPVLGQGNITDEMPIGTAICHKISDKAIRDKINDLLANTDSSILEAYLAEGIQYISPDHAQQLTPASGEYNKEVQKKLKTAQKAFNDFKNPSLKDKSEAAHRVGRSIANSPVNLFVGDSRQNSTNQEQFDPNSNFAKLTDTSADAYTPRSMKADVFSAVQHPTLRQGSSSSIPKGALDHDELLAKLKPVSQRQLNASAGEMPMGVDP